MANELQHDVNLVKISFETFEISRVYLHRLILTTDNEKIKTKLNYEIQKNIRAHQFKWIDEKKARNVFKTTNK